MTSFDNCQKYINQAEVTLYDVRYDYFDSMCDTIHANYLVKKKKDPEQKYEVQI